MNFDNDPFMKEIVDEFCKETSGLLEILEKSLNLIEEDTSNLKELEKFGQVIDRIMGAAKSIGATEMATFCELGKAIGYKSSQIKEKALIEVVVAILFDAIELLKKMNSFLKTGDDKSMSKLNNTAFIKRLNWLCNKFNDIERSSCAVDDVSLNQKSIDELMKNLGL